MIFADAGPETVFGVIATGITIAGSVAMAWVSNRVADLKEKVLKCEDSHKKCEEGRARDRDELEERDRRDKAELMTRILRLEGGKAGPPSD